jgi:hypothetical protein
VTFRFDTDTDDNDAGTASDTSADVDVLVLDGGGDGASVGSSGIRAGRGDRLDKRLPTPLVPRLADGADPATALATASNAGRCVLRIHTPPPSLPLLPRPVPTVYWQRTSHPLFLLSPPSTALTISVPGTPALPPTPLRATASRQGSGSRGGGRKAPAYAVVALDSMRRASVKVRDATPF